MSQPGTLERLEATIAARRGAHPDSSYVAKLEARDVWNNGQDFRVKSTVGVIPPLMVDEVDLVGEAADVLFHLLVLLGHKGVALADVLAELERREGTSGLDEKASRQG